MQQTDKYKLNKPGVDDPITPVPLNENMDKIEAALLTKADAATAADLTQRVTVLEGFHFACGSYYADIDPTVIELGFTPQAVYIHRLTSEYTDAHILVTGDTTTNMYLHIVENGFWHCSNNGYTMRGGTYHYIAFG